MGGKRKYGSWVCVDWMHLAQDRDQWRGLVKTVMNRWDTWKTENLLTKWATVGFSRRTLLCRVS